MATEASTDVKTADGPGPEANDPHHMKSADGNKVTTDLPLAITSSGEVVESHAELERNFSPLAALGMAFAMLNSWTAMSASLSVVLPSGGPVSMLWGLVVSAIGSMCMVLSLAEVCHIYPTQGGQIDWSFVLAPESIRKGFSWYVGWMTCAGWISLAATGSSLGAQFIIGIISLLHQDTYVEHPYQLFLIYLAFTIGAWALNVFAVRALPFVDHVALYWSLAGVVVVMITLLATASPNYQKASFVFGDFINETGWPTGVAFLLGLLQSTFGLTGFDAISHLTEEMPTPHIWAPKVMVMAVILGSTTSWIFILVLLFCLTDIDGVISGPGGPLLTIYFQATSSQTGAVCLLMFNVFAMAFATQGLLCIASRVVRAFARDRGFGRLSPWLAHIHPTLKAPVQALTFSAVWVVIFGLIYLGSSVALNAILSASVVFVQLSYMAIFGLLLFRGRGILNQPGLPARTLTLGGFGYPVNAFAFAFSLVTSIFFVFPPAIPVTGGSEMNWVIVVVFIVLFMSLVTWIVDGRKVYVGPTNMAKLLEMASRADMRQGDDGRAEHGDSIEQKTAKVE